MSIVIGELARSSELDREALAEIRGGFSVPSNLGPVANVNVVIDQNIVQLQNIGVNVLNNVGTIGAGFGPFALSLSPSQIAGANIAL